MPANVALQLTALHASMCAPGELCLPGRTSRCSAGRVAAAEFGRYAAISLRDAPGEGLTDLAAARPDGEERTDQQVE